MSNKRTFIIAEAGVNHNSDVSLAKKLIDLAVIAEVDAIKFQTFKAETLASLDAQKAAYQNQKTSSSESQFDMLLKLELTHDMHLELIDYCKQKDILFLSSPFDCESIDYLNQLKLPICKIPSGEITHIPYLRKIGQLNKKTILSTGMCTLKEIEFAINFLFKSGLDRSHLSLLHCTSEYPCPFEDVNLKAIETLKKEFGLPVGYSDHTSGITVPIAAVAMGATIIEKHFTLDKTLPGPDHQASLEPDELEQMVKAIREVEKAMGNGVKQPAKSELKNINIVRKSIVAKRRIKKGEVFTEDNLICKRPGTGLSPMQWDKVIGIKADKFYEEDQLINPEIS
ncbi:MAG: N-acetylneuraminate synthase [bacterium]